ncbi:glycosyl transferase, partial [Pyrobaculum aerophilum]
MKAYVTRFNPLIFPRPIFLARAIRDLEIYMLGKNAISIKQIFHGEDRTGRVKSLIDLLRERDPFKFIEPCYRQNKWYDGLSLFLETKYVNFFRRLPTKNIILMNLIGAIGAKLANKNIVIDMMDYWHCDKMYATFNAIDYYALRNAKCIVVWSKAIYAFLRRYLRHQCIRYIPFGLDLTLSDPKKVSTKYFFEKYKNINSYIIIGYSGGGEWYHGVDKLIKAY